MSEATPALDESAASPEVSNTEEQARNMGWRPREEFNGEGWVNAEIFVARAPLIDKIEGMGKALKRATADTAELRKHYEKVRETEYKRAVAELKVDRRAAVVEGDADALEAVEEQMEQLRLSRDAETAAAVKQTETFVADFSSWKNTNTWYGEHVEATEMADVLGVGYHNKGLTPEEVLERVAKDIKKSFPEITRNPNRDKPSGTVSGSSNKAGTGTSRSEGNLSSVEKLLSDEERQVMNKFVRSGMLTKEEYLKDLKAIKEEASNG